MKIQNNKGRLTTRLGAVLAFLAACTVLPAAEGSVVWNKESHSRILDDQVLSKPGTGVTPWKVRSMVWPSDTEISAASVSCSTAIKAEAAGWIRRFVRREYTPADLEAHMIAMRAWGRLFDKESEKLADVFIVRYRTGSSVIHIQESPYDVVVSIADDESDGKPRPVAERRAFVLETAVKVLDPNLLTDGKSGFYEARRGADSGTSVTSAFQWSPPSITGMDAKGQKIRDTLTASRIGAFSIKAETDGRFVRFDISKSPEAGPRLYRDPYVQRFEEKSR
jgi:hypothetical protein